jgi:hypothetical protein
LASWRFKNLADRAIPRTPFRGVVAEQFYSILYLWVRPSNPAAL